MSANVKQLLRGALVGGIIIYVVYAAAWMVFPWTNASVNDLREPAVIAAIHDSAKVAPGTYYLNANETRDGVGPGIYGWMTIHPSATYSVGRSLVGSLLQNIAVALCASWLVLRARGGYGARVAVAGVVGLVAILTGPVFEWIWTWYSTPYAAAMIANNVLAYGAMALALGKLVPGTEKQGGGAPAEAREAA